MKFNTKKKFDKLYAQIEDYIEKAMQPNSKESRAEILSRIYPFLQTLKELVQWDGIEIDSLWSKK